MLLWLRIIIMAIAFVTAIFASKHWLPEIISVVASTAYIVMLFVLVDALSYCLFHFLAFMLIYFLILVFAIYGEEIGINVTFIILPLLTILSCIFCATGDFNTNVTKPKYAKGVDPLGLPSYMYKPKETSTYSVNLIPADPSNFKEGTIPADAAQKYLFFISAVEKADTNESESNSASIKYLYEVDAKTEIGTCLEEEATIYYTDEGTPHLDIITTTYTCYFHYDYMMADDGMTAIWEPYATKEEKEYVFYVPQNSTFKEYNIYLHY